MKKMPRSRLNVLCGTLFLSLSLFTPSPAQESAQERAANLRAQLTETQAKQAELELRLQQLDEDLKPENIERSLAGVGSTHPEDLREARRRQLEIQKKGIQSQLEVLGASRTRLEAAIARADTVGYQQSAGGPNPGSAPANVTPSVPDSTQRSKKHRRKKRRPLKRPKA